MWQNHSVEFQEARILYKYFIKSYIVELQFFTWGIISAACTVMKIKVYLSLLGIGIVSTDWGLYCLTSAPQLDRFHLQTILENCSMASQTTFLRDRSVPIVDLLVKGWGKLGASVPYDTQIKVMSTKYLDLQETFTARSCSLSFFETVLMVVKAFSIEPFIGIDRRVVLRVKTSILCSSLVIITK